MNESELIDAYRRSVAEESDNIWRERAKAALIESGSEKCIVESCPTMIALYTGRSLCRFHEGKWRRGER